MGKIIKSAKASSLEKGVTVVKDAGSCISLVWHEIKTTVNGLHLLCGSGIIGHMDIQTTYYILGIIFMSMCIVLLTGMLILVFYIWRKVTQMQQLIEEKIDDITNNPGEIVTDIGAAVVSKAVKQAKKYFNSAK
jgi:hypothetical protein